MAPSRSETNSWSTNDRACAHCRERKIRCGRERPQCANCKRDGVECGYSTPGKRVNHIKLLCNNIGGLEDRLSSIEGELSNLANSLRASSQSPFIDSAGEGRRSSDSHSAPDAANDSPSLAPVDRHIVRSQEDLVDRYHGPWSLFALCNEFRDTTISDNRRSQSPSATREERPQSNRQDSPAEMESVKVRLARMCEEASFEEVFNPQLGRNNPIRLPPKQFLLMVQSQFFQQADYTTDIFVESSFAAHVERIYSQHNSAVDESWVICFNTIILLVLGSENSSHANDSQAGSQFSQPFLSAVRTALANRAQLMAPRLINVQTLALLSIAAQKYFAPGFAEHVFAQVCVLARTMGLHQTYATSTGLSAEEAQERGKVFRSLYLRDKSFAIARGSLCWLPSFDCNLSSELEEVPSVDQSCTARVELAKIQEDIYRLFHSAESPRQTIAQHKSALARIEQNLERWADGHDIFSPRSTSSRNVDLQLEFFAARISAFRGGSDARLATRALNDARASCQLLLASYGKHDQSMMELLETLPVSKSPSKNLGKMAAPRSSKSKNSKKDSISENGNEVGPVLGHSLLDTFSVSAFFLLAKNVLWPDPSEDESQSNEDLNILQKVCSCYKELDSRTQTQNHSRKVGRAFEILLEIANIVKNPQQFQMSPYTSNESSTCDTPTSTQNFFGGSQDMSDFGYLPTPTSCPVPSTSSWNIAPMRKISTNTTDPSTGAQTGFVTPVELEFGAQTYDPLPQHAFNFSNFQQQNSIPSPPSRKRPCLHEPDIPMGDFSDAGLFSDFLTTTPMLN